MEKDLLNKFNDQYFWDGYCKEIHPTWRTPVSQLVFNEGFRRGMKFIYNELSKWKDPNVELPEDDIEVLCKTDDRNVPYVVLKYNKCGWWIRFDGGWGKPNFNIIGWQPIYK